MPKAPEPSSTCQKNTKSLPRISPKSYCYNAVPNRFLAHFSTSRTNGPRLLSRAKAGTHSPSPTGSHTAAYTAKQGRFRWGRYYYPRRALRAAETPDGRLQKRLICRFLRSGGRSSPHDFYFLANMQVSLSENSVATTFALWYNKSKELEEFQNNYAVKFPFAIASSSPGPRPEQQKGSAIP